MPPNLAGTMRLSTRKKPSLTQALERDLLQLHGAAAIGGAELRAALGYKTAIAFRVAISRQKVGVPLFKISGRKGYWCLVKDIAIWLATARAAAKDPAGDQETSKPANRKGR